MSDKPTPQEIATQIAIAQRNAQADSALNANVELHLAKARIAELEAQLAAKDEPKE